MARFDESLEGDFQVARALLTGSAFTFSTLRPASMLDGIAIIPALPENTCDFWSPSVCPSLSPRFFRSLLMECSLLGRRSTQAGRNVDDLAIGRFERALGRYHGQQVRWFSTGDQVTNQALLRACDRRDRSELGRSGNAVGDRLHLIHRA